jgi:hypothetical protein
VLVVDERNGMANPLAKRCTYGVVWSASASVNPQGTALALAVQPTDAWRELWLFRETKTGWKLRVVPPAAVNPELGYAELAGWTRDGRARVAREAIADGKPTGARRASPVVALAGR